MVTVANFQFSPANINVAVGDTVRWVWSDGSHTTTSTSVPQGADGWNSPMNSTSKTFDYIIKVAGSYSYWCIPHAPNMAGTITASATLPVVLSSFNIIPVKNNSANIQWSTSTETNTDHFNVKRSTDGNNYTTVTTVKAAGNSSVINNYSVIDNNLNTGYKYIYYMLEIVDKDGSATYSSIQRFINNSAAKKLVTQISPNPVTAPGHLMFQFNADKEDAMLVQLFDGNGKLVKQADMHAEQGLNNGHFHRGNLPAGTYTVVFTMGKTKESYRVVMQ